MLGRKLGFLASTSVSPSFRTVEALCFFFLQYLYLYCTVPVPGHGRYSTDTDMIGGSLKDQGLFLGVRTIPLGSPTAKNQPAAVFWGGWLTAGALALTCFLPEKRGELGSVWKC
jgi:hypothetical protein